MGSGCLNEWPVVHPTETEFRAGLALPQKPSYANFQTPPSAVYKKRQVDGLFFNRKNVF